MFFTRQSFLFALSSFLVACFVTFSVFAQSSVSAFNYSTDGVVDPSIARSNSNEQSVQSWPIDLTTEFRQLTEGGAFVVPLPNGESISAEVISRNEYENGDVQLISRVDNGGSIVITMGDNVAFGSINDGTVSYSIGLNNNRRVALVDNQSIQNEVDLSNDMRFAPTSPIDDTSVRSARTLEDLKRLSAQNTGESTIDLLVVYSSEFAALFGAPGTRINQLVSFTNASFADSGILINLRLVAALEIGFDNTNFEISFDQVFDDLDVILDDATDGVGDFTSLPALRNQHGADLVAVLSANTNSTAAAGVAWVLNSSENPVTGVSTTMLSINCCDSVFAHELGHNLGSIHQLGDCDGGYTGFSCGFRNTQWATIMSSSGNKSIIGYLFSNTDNDCLGSTCGLAGSADNRTSFNLSRLVVSQFRDEVTTPTIPTTPNNSETGWLPGVLFNLLDEETN